MKEYTGLLDLHVRFKIIGMGGNKSILESSIKQKIAGLINSLRDENLTIIDYELDASGSESISQTIETMIDGVN